MCGIPRKNYVTSLFIARVDYITKNDLKKIINPAVAMRQRE